jgi:ribosome modulation factor
MDGSRPYRMAQWWLCVIEGYNDALMGKRYEDCPKTHPQERIAWMHGWRSRAWAAQEEARYSPGVSTEGAAWAAESARPC